MAVRTRLSAAGVIGPPRGLLNLWPFCLVLLWLWPVDSSGEAGRVIILVNANHPESVALGDYYAGRRGIPPANIVALPTPDRETISWGQFVETIHNPLLRWLMEENWIDGEWIGGTDNFGRKRALIFGHRISFLAVCRGIPLKISHDGSRVTEAEMEAVHRQLRTTRGAVDSELALLPWPGYPVQGVVANPLYENREATFRDHQRVVKVSRLDGPSHESALALVDGALEGERTGLLGRAYIDLLGANPIGRDWLAEARDHLRDLGFSLSVHEKPGVFPAAARFDAPVLYFGWYAGSLTGPFALEGFRFPPGAIAYHIHSGSASTLRDRSRPWTGPLVARGAAASFGSVFEPYIELIHQPNLLLEKLAEGAALGEAAAFAVPFFSWQSIVVGDPLYRPFTVSLEEQLADFETAPWPLSPYAAIRQMNLLASERGRGAEALAFGQRALKRIPHLALGVEVALLQNARRDRRGARQTLEQLLPLMEGLSVDQVMLAREAADLLAQFGGGRTALAIYQAILEQQAWPTPLAEELLRGGAALAEREGDLAMAEAWRTRLEILRTPPEPAPNAQLPTSNLELRYSKFEL